MASSNIKCEGLSTVQVEGKILTEERKAKPLLFIRSLLSRVRCSLHCCQLPLLQRLPSLDFDQFRASEVWT